VAVDDFHVVGVSFPPDEADSELIVDSDTVLAFPISFQRLAVIAGEDRQVT
jgi:hypothetical protein